MGYTSRKLRVLKFATGTERENVVVSKENEFCFSEIIVPNFELIKKAVNAHMLEKCIISLF